MSPKGEIKRRPSSLHVFIIEFGCHERKFLSRCQINGVRWGYKSQTGIGNQ